VHDGQGDFCVLDLDQPQRAVLIHHQQASAAAIAADGRWLVTFGGNALGLTIWDAQRGDRAAAVLDDRSIPAAVFSPDGESLVVDLGPELAALAVGTWRETNRVAMFQTKDVPASGSQLSLASNVLAMSRDGYEINLLCCTRKH
jgi:hypothetical protein